MKKIYDYFSVNWELTSDRIKHLLNGIVEYEVFAGAIGVSERTLYDWIENKTNPPIDKLLLMSKFFNVDFWDIVILNKEIERPVSPEEFKKYLIEEPEVKESNKMNDKENDFRFKSEEAVINQIIYNEFRYLGFPIKNLNEFLLILPLVDATYLMDFYRRILGNIGENENYVFTKLAFLYDRIPNDNSKKFVELYKKEFLEYGGSSIPFEESVYFKHPEMFEAYNGILEKYSKLLTGIYIVREALGQV